MARRKEKIERAWETHPLFDVLLKQWDSEKNEGELTDYSPGSEKEVWWKMSYDDPASGKHFEFEWKQRICSYAKHAECPYLTNRAVWTGFNDLETLYPDIAAEWHPTRNGELTPSQVNSLSHRRVWWYLSYDDPVSKKHFDFEWDEYIDLRTTSGYGCPYLSGRRVWPGYNDLETHAPDVAKLWHPTRNGELTPSDVLYSSTKSAWWNCPECGYEYEQSIKNAALGKRQCPCCNNRVLVPGNNDLQTSNPELCEIWDYDNNEKTPQETLRNSNEVVNWICTECGSSYQRSIYIQKNLRVQSCRICNGKGMHTNVARGGFVLI